MCFPTQPIVLDLDPRYHNDDDGGGGGFLAGSALISGTAGTG